MKTKIIPPLFFLSSLMLFITSCNFKSASDPFDNVPENSSAIWQPIKGTSINVTSNFYHPYIPENFTKDQLSLSELLDVALKNNPSTKKTWSEALSAAAQYGQSLSPYFPEVDVTGTYNRVLNSDLEKTPLGTFLRHQYETIISPDVSLSYTIYDFGQRKNFSEKARLALYYADWTHNREIQTVIQVIVDDYYDYLYQKEALVAQNANLEDAEECLDAALQKFQTGIAAVGDVTQAKSKYLQTKMNLLAQQRRVDVSFATLAKDIGLPANITLNLDNFPSDISTAYFVGNLTELISVAQEKRQDLIAAHSYFQASEANVAYAKSQTMPVLNSSFDIGKSYYNKGIVEDYHFNLLFKVSYPLFRGFFYKNQIKNAKANLMKAKAYLEDTELTVIKDVTTVYSDVTHSAEILNCSKDYLATSKERFKIEYSSYKVGTVTILDLLAAQSNLADARAKSAEAKKDWFSSLSDLAYATGTLCSSDEEININEGQNK
jgi:outer membrane protein